MSAEAEYPLGAECDVDAIVQNVTVPALLVPTLQALADLLVPGVIPASEVREMLGLPGDIGADIAHGWFSAYESVSQPKPGLGSYSYGEQLPQVDQMSFPVLPAVGRYGYTETWGHQHG